MMISKNSFLYRTRLHKDELTETEDEIIEFISKIKVKLLRVRLSV